MPLAKFSESFGSKRVVDLIFSSLQTGDFALDQLVVDAHKIEHESISAVRNTCLLLIDSKVVVLESGVLSLSAIGTIQEFYKSLRDYLLSCFFVEGLGNSAKSPPGILLCIDSYFLPKEYLTFPHIAYTVGLLGGPIDARFWPFSLAYKDIVLSRIVNEISLPTSNQFSPQDLENKLKAQAEAGLRAELWFLSKEKERLANHVLVDCIKRISEVNVAAGYDIASFGCLESLNYDRYIEVKSFVGDPCFYISENELLVANNLRDSYVLVVIDRDKINIPGYTPLELKDPYPLLMSSDKPDWIVIKPSNLYVTLNFS